MIIFEKVRYKNLLSAGEQFLEIPLNENRQTLFMGTNGAGKSLVIEAITFALFDKPFRKISKSKLVNSVNKKNTIVEIYFSIGNSKFTIRRGIKPNIFEIYKNGKMLDQLGSNKEMQKYLESNILKMNYKSFTQVVVLGSSSYTPFMELATPDRRVIVEELLDIKIFSSMSILAKSKFSNLKLDLSGVDSRYEATVEKIDLIKNQLEMLKAQEKERNAKAQEEIKAIEEQNVKLKSNIKKIDDKIDELQKKLSKHADIYDKSMKIRTNLSLLDNKKKELQERVKFFEENDNCPTCEQKIESDFKVTIKDGVLKEIKNIEEKIDDLNQKKEKIETIKDKLNNVQAKVIELHRKKDQIESKINSNNSIIKRIENDSKEIDNSFSIKENEGILKQLNENLKELEVKKEQIQFKIENYQYVLNYLKDSGIKTQIIKQYLPIMNKKINEYIDKMNFPVSFEIDEEFDENIKSRYRDSFSYGNFSEGEKQRINLALLLTWRKIAQMRNSTATNLLILDEVFDSSLDVDGTEGFLNILRELGEENNVIVISHKGDSLFEKFDNVIEFKKIGNFSHIEKKAN